MLEEAVDNIRGAVMIAFPQGLPEWDLVRQALEGTEELAGTSVSAHPIDTTTGSDSVLLHTQCFPTSLWHYKRARKVHLACMQHDHKYFLVHLRLRLGSGRYSGKYTIYSIYSRSCSDSCFCT